MRRRSVIGLGLGMLAVPAFAKGVARVRPGAAGWPGAAAWKSLGEATGGRLQALGPQPARAPAEPFALGDDPALTQSAGWIDAWTSQPSAYAVAAETPQDVAAAVRFAARHRLRLVVKGGGHSYLGGSTAPDSLLVWTRRMNAVSLHDGFVLAGSDAPPVPAVSLGAGCLWIDAYQAVTTRGGRYVQGGGCTTVGVAGLIQGGGFGSFSKTYGLGAASLIEAEIVTADGRVRTVNAAQEPDLFWALKGGGGGSFGIVTRLTLRTHDLPATFGAAFWRVKATSDAAFERLLARFVDLYADRLFNAHWGEQVRAARSNRIEVQMLFAGLSQAEAKAAWAPLAAFVAGSKDYVVERPLTIVAFPARKMWDEAFLKANVPDAYKPGPGPGRFFWASNTDEVGAFWHGYDSLWLPQSLLEPAARARLVAAWFAASRHWSVTMHFNKGLAAAPQAAIAAARDTAMNPQVVDAFALAIIAECETGGFGRTPDLAAARADAAAIRKAGIALRQAAPGGGSYLSECDYHLADWQRACWGEHWPRLSRVKARYDPDGLFSVHHGVGSERWSADGFTPA